MQKQELAAVARKLGPWFVFAAALLYVSIGARPFVPIEGDGIYIAAGAYMKASIGTHEFSYRPDCQMGTYWLIESLYRWLGMEPWRAFCALSMVACAGFIAFASVFVSRVARLSLPLCGIVLLLFQEAYTVGYYPNSNVIAAFFLAAAALVALGDRTWQAIASGLLLSLAIWSRFDAVLVAPVFPLILWKGGSIPWRRIIINAGSVALALLALMYLSEASIASIFREVSNHGERTAPTGWQRTFNSYLTVFSGLTCLLLVLGSYLYAADRQWRPLLIAAAGFLPLAVVYGNTVTTPKYFLYSMMFLAIPMAHAVSFLVERPPAGKRLGIACAAVLLLIGQYVLAPPSLPRQVHTADGKRPLGGIIFGPATMARHKQQMAVGMAGFRSTLREYLASTDSPCIAVGYSPELTTVYYELVVNHDYRPREQVDLDTVFTKEGSVATILNVRRFAGNPDSSPLTKALASNENMPSRILSVHKDWSRGCLPGYHCARPALSDGGLFECSMLERSQRLTDKPSTKIH